MLPRFLKNKFCLILGLATLGFSAAVSNAAESAPYSVSLPTAKDNTGGAVLIVPDPAAKSADPTTLAKWLNDRGLAAFVFRASGPAADKTAAAASVARAVQQLRAHAAEYKISAKRVALLGFGGGADIAAEAAYNQVVEANVAATDAAGKFSSRPDLLAVIWGPTSVLPPAGTLPPTFIVGSTSTGDNLSGSIELWNKLRAARASVDAHFFAKADLKTVLAADNASVGSWPEIFYAWTRFCGLMTEEKRLPVKGMVYLNGHTLPHGYVIFTPVDFVGAGPIIGRVLNSTAGEALGLFKIPADQGPIAGRYKVEVYQTMNRWLSNSFSSDLVGGRGGASPEKTYFGHYRLLSPTIDDYHVFSKVRPSDRSDLFVEFKSGADANLDLKIEVFSK